MGQDHPGDAAVFIGFIIVGPRRGVHAAGIGGQVRLVLPGQDSPPHHGHGIQNVKYLRHTGGRVGAAAAVHPAEQGFDETGSRREIPRQAKSAGPHPKGREGERRGKGIFRQPGRKAQILPGIFTVEGKGRVVGQHAEGIFIDLHPGGGLLHHKAARGVRHQPMERGQRQVRAEGNLHQFHPLQQGPGLGQGPAAAQQVRDQLIGRQPPPPGGGVGPVAGVAGKVEPRRAEALFIDGLGIEGIIVRHMGHPDHGIVGRHGPRALGGKGEIAGGDDHGLPKAALKVHIPPKIKGFSGKGKGCTHRFFLLVPNILSV